MLKDPVQAREYLHEQGLLLQTPHATLPSLFAAAQGEPAKPGAGGFGDWPERAWWWGGELADDPNVLVCKLLCRRTTYVSRPLWPALDAAVRGGLPDTFPADQDRLVKLLREQGPTRSDQLKARAGFKGPSGTKAFGKAKKKLEELGAVLSTSIVVDNHKHVSQLELWEQRFPQPLSQERGLEGILLAALRASGGSPQRDLLKWFPWGRASTAEALARLLAAGQLALQGDEIVPVP